MPGLGLHSIPGASVTLQGSGGSIELLGFLALAFLGGLYLIYDGFGTWKLARLIQDTPTAKVRSMAVGRTELQGTVRKHGGTIQPPYTNEECVYVAWKAERREKHTDKDGNVHYTWETVADGTEALAFDLEDPTGRVLVRADLDRPEFDIRDAGHGQTVEFGHGQMPPERLRAFMHQSSERRKRAAESASGGLFHRAVSFADDLLEEDDPLTYTGNRRRYSQTILPVGTEIYLYGSAEPRSDARMDGSQADLLQIRRDGETGQFLVADRGEEALRKRYSRMGPIKTIGGLVLSTVALYFLLSQFAGPVG